MELLLKEHIDKLQEQHNIYGEAELKDLTAVVKLFALNSNYTWYLLTQDPNDPNYLWAIVDGHAVEMGPVSLSELLSLKWMGAPQVERDIYWEPCNAKELWDKLQEKWDQAQEKREQAREKWKRARKKVDQAREELN